MSMPADLARSETVSQVPFAPGESATSRMCENPWMDLGQTIRSLRKAAKMRQIDLATALEISTTSVSDWETGKKQPAIERLPAIAGVFEITVDGLLAGLPTSAPLCAESPDEEMLLRLFRRSSGAQRHAVITLLDGAKREQ